MSDRFRLVHVEYRPRYEGSRATYPVFVEAVTGREFTLDQIVAQYNTFAVDEFFRPAPPPTDSEGRESRQC